MVRVYRISTVISILLFVQGLFMPVMAGYQNPDTITHADIVERFALMGESGVQEKLYITTDKPYYKAGESIWFSGFLVDAMTHRPVTDTRYIYVELVSSTNRVVTRAKVMADPENRFHNRLELDADLTPGDYCLVGYTQWMKNHGREFFFTQKIPIAKERSGKVTTNTSFSHRGPYNKTMHVTFTNQRNEPYVQERLLCRLMSGREQVRSFYVTTNDNGTADVELSIPRDTLISTAIFMSTTRDFPYSFTAFVTMPTLSDDFSVGFYPEGGYFIPGAYQNIAFKGIGADGLSVDFTGKLYDGDELITEFSPVHHGMGVIRLRAGANSRLRAEVTSNAGLVKNFDIPVDQTGMALSVVRRGDKYACHIDHTPELATVSLILIVHNRGRLVMAHMLGEQKSDFSIPANPLLPGISEIAIADPRSGDILSRRLVFQADENPVQASITTDTTRYGQRSPVRATIELRNPDNTPVRGDIALSVTNFTVVRRDSYEENINTYLLLSSDLKGYIEEPGSYFSMYAEQERLTDLLMMTQGWTRFDLSSVIKGDVSNPEYEKERSISLSGRVTGISNKSKNSILYSNPGKNENLQQNLDPDGRFCIRDVDFTSNDNIILQAIRRSGTGKGLNLEMDEVDAFIGMPYSAPRPRLVEGPTSSLIPVRYINNSHPPVRYRMENGIRVVDFESVVVRRNRPIAEDSYVPAEVWGQEEIGKVSDKLFIDIYEKVTGLPVPERLLISQRPIPVERQIPDYEYNTRYTPQTLLERQGMSFVDIPLFYYDGNPTPLRLIQFLRVSDLASIEVITGPQARTIDHRARKVIVLRSKSGNGVLPSHTTLSISKLSGVGPKPPVAFYQPPYDVAEESKNYERDFRSTIAWEPALTTGPDGRCEISFYTSDSKAYLELRLEGLSEDGRTFTAQTTIMTGVE